MSARATQFRHPTYGAIYVTDQFNRPIRKIDRNGIVTTLASTMDLPDSVAVDSVGNVYYSDNLVHRLFRIDGGSPTFSPTLIVGDGTASSTDGGPGADATVNTPFGITLDPFGNLYILEAEGRKIRKVEGAAPAAPTFTAAGVTKGASFQAGGLQLGSIATIFGVHLANIDGLMTDGGQLPPPTEIAGTSSVFLEILAPLYAVGKRQVSPSTASREIVCRQAFRRPVSVPAPRASLPPGSGSVRSRRA